MLRARVIPCLLVRNNGLVKTRRFADDKYVGDPINAVKIFNEKEVDEIIVLDIDATVQGREPNYRLIENLATECRMPLCYGGGVSSADQATRIMALGVEKIALSGALVRRPELASEIAERVGSQSVVAVLDVKRRMLGMDYRVYVQNGKKDTGASPVELATHLERRGIGEIAINSIDRDGMMNGYDLKLAERIRKAVQIPMTILGGAGSLDHMRQAVSQLGTIGVSAGSFFVFKGPYRAVLISYPPRADRLSLQRWTA